MDKMTSSCCYLMANEMVNHRSSHALFVSSSTTDREFNFHMLFNLMKQACHGKNDVVEKVQWCINGFIYGQFFKIKFVDDIKQALGAKSLGGRPTLIAFDGRIDTQYYKTMSYDGFRVIHGKRVIDAFPKTSSKENQNLARAVTAGVNAVNRVDSDTDYDLHDLHQYQLFSRLTRIPSIPAY